MSDMILMRTDQDDGYVNLTAASGFEIGQTSDRDPTWAVYATFGAGDPSISTDIVEIPGTYSHSPEAAQAKLDEFVRNALGARIYKPSEA